MEANSLSDCFGCQLGPGSAALAEEARIYGIPRKNDVNRLYVQWPRGRSFRDEHRFLKTSAKPLIVVMSVRTRGVMASNKCRDGRHMLEDVG